MKNRMFFISLLASLNPLWALTLARGVILRYDATSNEVVGLTLIGLRARLLQNLPHVRQSEAI